MPAPEAHTGAFPPFETSTFLAQLIWLALAFGAALLPDVEHRAAADRRILHARAERDRGPTSTRRRR